MDNGTETFEVMRPRLMGLAYRMLGSVSDAQDAVQDIYIMWATHEGPAIETPAAWLSRVCTNGCFDRLNAAHKTRVDYVGPWIPDQIRSDYEAGPKESVEIASSLTTAFLLLLERLTPKERAACLLHDIFDMPFDEVAGILDLQPANCGKLAARARVCVAQGNLRHIPEKARQSELLAAFQSAVETENTDTLAVALHADANMRAYSGGKVVAVRHVIEGPSHICRFISAALMPAWRGMQLSVININELLAMVVKDDAKLHASVSFSYDPRGRVRQVFVMRHPDKLDLLRDTRSTSAKAGALWLR